MAIVGGDLLAYASANMPIADTGTNGGAIDPLRRVDFTQIAANDTIQVVSSNAADTMNVTVVGRSAAGTIVTETKALTGTTAINLSTLGTVERILSADLASAPAGTVTVRRTTGPTTIRTIPAGERGFMAIFQRVASDPSVTKDFYTKIFLKNNHATLSLLSATVAQSADPDARVTFVLANAVNDSATSTNRVTAPSAANTLDPDTFDDTTKSVPGTDLAATAAIGVWLKLSLPANDPPHRSTFDIQLAGQSV